VRVSFLASAQDEDTVLEWLQQAACLGAETQEEAGRLRFSVYFAADASTEDSLEQLRRLLGSGVTVDRDPVADEHWVEAYHQGLKPFRVGRRFVVHPDATSPPGDDSPEAPISLWIPPGRAFGTGDHATTRLCLEYLERCIAPGHHVLDVGTGSGILAVAAVRLGASRVAAVEVDPDSARVARENFRRNRVSHRVELKVGTTAAVSGGWFDVATANLHSGILVESMPDLAHLLRPGGSAVLSGILIGESGSVGAAAARRGLAVVGERTSGEWLALEVEKSG
jgi:ribosomal protein L11 methyltransferase